MVKKVFFCALSFDYKKVSDKNFHQGINNEKFHRKTPDLFEIVDVDF